MAFILKTWAEVWFILPIGQQLYENVQISVLFLCVCSVAFFALSVSQSLCLHSIWAVHLLSPLRAKEMAVNRFQKSEQSIIISTSSIMLYNMQSEPVSELCSRTRAVCTTKMATSNIFQYHSRQRTHNNKLFVFVFLCVWDARADCFFFCCCFFHSVSYISYHHAHYTKSASHIIFYTFLFIVVLAVNYTPHNATIPKIANINFSPLDVSFPLCNTCIFGLSCASIRWRRRRLTAIARNIEQRK